VVVRVQSRRGCVEERLLLLVGLFGALFVLVGVASSMKDEANPVRSPFPALKFDWTSLSRV